MKFTILAPTLVFLISGAVTKASYQTNDEASGRQQVDVSSSKNKTLEQVDLAPRPASWLNMTEEAFNSTSGSRNRTEASGNYEPDQASSGSLNTISEAGSVKSQDEKTSKQAPNEPLQVMIDPWLQGWTDSNSTDSAAALEDVREFESQFTFNIFAITFPMIFRFFIGYISGLIGYDVTWEWNQCMGGLNYFVKWYHAVLNALWGLLMFDFSNIKTLTALVKDIQSQSPSQINKCSYAWGEYLKAFEFGTTHSAFTELALLKNIVLHFVPLLYQSKDIFTYLLNAEYFESGKIFGAILMSMLEE